MASKDKLCKIELRSFVAFEKASFGEERNTVALKQYNNNSVLNLSL